MRAVGYAFLSWSQSCVEAIDFLTLGAPCFTVAVLISTAFNAGLSIHALWQNVPELHC